MGLFEDVIINAKSAANVVGKKAGQIVDISKLRINAADLNNEIAKRYEALGRTVYESKKSENDSEELVQECIAAIDDLYEQIDAVNEQISAISEKAICPACGEANPPHAAYCSKCGTKLPIHEEKAEEKPSEPENKDEE